jgi:hypothetical protein
MPAIHRYSFLILCIGLLVQSRYFHQPLILYDEFMAMLESNSYDDLSDDRKISLDDDENLLEQLFNNFDSDRTLKSNLRTNLHLPRYLRHID